MPSSDDLAKAATYRARAERCRAEAKRYWFRRDRIEELNTAAWVLDHLADEIEAQCGVVPESDPDAIFKQD